MNQSEILMARKANFEGWEGVIPGTPFLKKAISRVEVGPGFWLVNDAEDGCWYVIDKASGLMATRAPSSTKEIGSASCRERVEIPVRAGS